MSEEEKTVELETDMENYLTKFFIMTNQTKSLIRHMLTALGVLLAALGLGNASGLIEELLSNLDVIWDAVLVIVGTIVTIVGFFRNKDRFKS